MVAQFIGQMIVFADTGFHSKDNDPPNMKVCKRGEWNVRMIVETVLGTACIQIRVALFICLSLSLTSESSTIG